MIKPPYPYFGGKYTVKEMIWPRLGYTPNFVDPFFGGGSSLWFNPDFDWNTGQWRDDKKHLETVNDIDGMISNFWRSIKHDPESVAKYADWPVIENDLHARHIWLVYQKEGLVPKLEGDPEYYDPKIAGYWVWGMCAWIGSKFCSGQGPWGLDEDRQLIHLGNNGQGINRQLIHLRNNGQGINRQLIHLGTNGQGINRQLIHLGTNGQGINRNRIHLGTNGQGINRQWSEWLEFYFQRLQDRLRRVRVCCGDWKRVIGPTPTVSNGLTAVFLDPPYASNFRDRVYTHDDFDVASEVRDWAVENGNDPMLRIALCGYDDFEMPDDWNLVRWSTQGGYSHQAQEPSDNRHREVIWFSPNCIKQDQLLQMEF